MSRARLSNTTLAQVTSGTRVPDYDRAKVTPGIVHLGIGAFHRAHMAVYVDDLLARDPSWGIVGASLRRPDTKEALEPQEGLYTIAVRDAEGTHPRVIGSILRVMDAITERDELLALMADPATSHIMNCGYGRGFSVLEVLDAVDRVTNQTIVRKMESRRAGDPDALIADNARILATTPWRPRLDDLDTIVVHALAWERKMASESLRSPTQVRATEYALERAEIALKNADGMRKQLVEFSGPKVRRNIEAKIASVEADLQAQKEAFSKEEQRKDRLEKAIAAINAARPQPDFIVFTGDLTHMTKDPAERRKRMTEVKAMLGRLENQTHVYLAGEHDAGGDRGAAFQEVFGKLNQSFDHKGFHFVTLDNASDPKGALGAAQLEWLAADLKVAQAKAEASETVALIEHLKLQILKLRRQIYGVSSERTARLIDQLELELSDLEADATEDANMQISDYHDNFVGQFKDYSESNTMPAD